MANRFIGGILSSKQPQSGGFVSRASTGTYFDNTGTLVTAPINQPRLNYSFTGQPAANRYSSLFTSASTNYLSTVTAASALGTGNFTMEFWWKANSTTQSSYSNVINQGFTGSPSNGAFAFKVYAGTGSNVLNFTYYNSGISDNATTANVNDLAWHHIAASRNGTSLGIYVDGVLNTTITLPASFNMGASGGTTYIGYNPRDASYINGNVKDLRLITGQALYSGTFIPPTAPLTTTTVGSTGAGAAATLTGTVILLTCQTASLNDVSSNNYSITNTNTVTSSTLLPNNLGIDTSGTGWYNPTTLIEPTSTNLLVYSQNYNSGWTTEGLTSITLNAIAPDGTTTANTLLENSSASNHRIYQNYTVNAYGVLTASAFLKAGTRRYAALTLTDSSQFRLYVVVDLITGTVVSNGVANALTGVQYLNSSIISVGNGWYRVALTGITTTNTTAYTQVCMLNSISFPVGGVFGYTGSGSDTLLVWGLQTEVGYSATSYIPTIASTVARAQDDVGPLGSGIYTLAQLENQTAIDDQATVQSFTATGSTTWTAPADVTSVEVLVVAGGGSGGGGSGAIGGGGGGAGGIIYNTSYAVVPGTTYPVVVGAGGVGALRNVGTNGVNSQFGSLVALGGGAGGSDASLSAVGRPGGSGGGGTGRSGIGAGGTAGQGYPGSNGATNAYYAGGAGGGAGGPATPFFGSVAGSGGPGLYFNISGTSTAYGGGGGGGGSNYSSVSTAGTGGVGGGGNGTSTSINGNPGTANTGGGGGASGWSVDGTNIYGGDGGSGIVIIKYKRTAKPLTSTSNAAVVVQKFSVSNVWTVPAGVTQVEALVVAGGGGGCSGGGGAGGVVYNSAFSVTPGSSYTVTVGAGGNGGYCDIGSGAAATNGSNSVFGTLTAIGGGKGGQAGGGSGYQTGGDGGSGGGAAANGAATNAGGASTQNSAGSTGFGNAGGGNGGFTSSPYGVGGGGGAGQAGQTALSAGAFNGGAGLPFGITGNLEYYAGGGGGGAYTSGSFSTALGGVGGGGKGGVSSAGQAGTPNTGGGGGGAAGSGAGALLGGAGGSGVVIIRYRVPTVATFLDSGSWTCSAGVTSVQALIVGGGGSGSIGGGGGGGGAGGLIYSSSIQVTPGVTYPIVVGQGGAGVTGGPDINGTAGQNSSFANLIAVGGGQGARNGFAGQNGGSGGGGYGGGSVGSGTYGQGNSGGTGVTDSATYTNGGGGGGAGSNGLAAIATQGGQGGAGLAFTISGTSTYYAGGGAGGCQKSGGTAQVGGVGGGGGNQGAPNSNGLPGTQNTGGGGGGASYTSASVSSGAGGSGIVILRWYGG